MVRSLAGDLDGAVVWSPAAIGTSHGDAPTAYDLSDDHRASRDAYDVDPAASDEDLHPNSGDLSPADAGDRTI